MAALVTLEIKEPPPCITGMRLPRCVPTVPPESEADCETDEGGGEVACEGFPCGEGEEGEEGDVGGEGGGGAADEAADGGCCCVGP
jgi:hypothetical protein